MATEQPSSSPKTVVDRKVRIQLRLFFAIAVIMLVVLIIRAIQGIGWEWFALSLAAGAAVGYLASRSSVLSWDAAAGSVVSQMDVIGAIVLIAYLVFVFTKDRIVGHWLHDQQQVAAIGVGLTAGAMIARVIVTLSGIKNVLIAAGISRPQPIAS